MTELDDTIITGEQLDKLLRDTIADIDSTITTWNNGNILSNGEVLCAVEAALQNVTDDTARDVIMNMVRDVIHKADVSSGAEPASTALLISGLVKYIVTARISGGTDIKAVRDVHNVMTRVMSGISNIEAKMSSTTLQELISSGLKDEKHVALVSDALELAGLEGRIVFETIPTRENQVELTMGNCFDTVRPMMQVAGAARWDEHDVRVACIDGVIENVAELDRLLTAASETKEPLVIFARKFCDDAIRTCMVNMRRGTLNVMPVIVPYDLDSVNVLKDIAVVCNGTVLNVFEGRLVNTLDLKDLPIVETVRLTNSDATIDDSGSRERISHHIDSLRSELDNEHKRSFILKRMKALSAKNVFVRVSNHDMLGAAAVDRTLRRIRSAFKHGVVSRTKMRGIIDSCDMNPAVHDVLCTWIDSQPSMVPKLAALAALKFAYSHAALLGTTGAVLTLQR